MKKLCALMVILLLAAPAYGAQESIPNRHIYLKNIHTKIQQLTRNLDHVMHQRAFSHNSEYRQKMAAVIRDLRYKRDILMQHKRNLEHHGFWQVQQL